MSANRFTQSHYVQTTQNTPSNVHFITLSPKRKSKRVLHNEQSEQSVGFGNMQSDYEEAHKENSRSGVNVEIINMPIRVEKPFAIIPKYREEDLIVKPKSSHLSEPQTRSGRKKISVTSLQGDANRSQASVYPVYTRPFEQAVAEEHF